MTGSLVRNIEVLFHWVRLVGFRARSLCKFPLSNFSLSPQFKIQRSPVDQVRAILFQLLSHLLNGDIVWLWWIFSHGIFKGLAILVSTFHKFKLDSPLLAFLNSLPVSGAAIARWVCSRSRFGCLNVALFQILGHKLLSEEIGWTGLHLVQSLVRKGESNIFGFVKNAFLNFAYALIWGGARIAPLLPLVLLLSQSESVRHKLASHEVLVHFRLLSPGRAKESFNDRLGQLFVI